VTATVSKTNELAEDFVLQLRTLVGKPCWSVVAGAGTGSRVALDFGRKFQRDVPCPNPHLTADQQNYDSEISLFIECAWRLDTSTEVLCSSSETDSNDGPMVSGLNSLVDHEVESIDVVPPAFDLVVRFAGGLSLKIFCDQTNLDDGWDNYSLHLRDRIFIVGPRGRITTEVRD
jgi:hypothetical protein